MELFNITSRCWVLTWSLGNSLLRYLSPLHLLKRILSSRKSSGEKDDKSSIETSTTKGKDLTTTNPETCRYMQHGATLSTGMPEYHHFILNGKQLSSCCGLLLKRLSYAYAPASVLTTTTPQPNQQNIICIGIFSTVHRLDDEMVRKVPSPSNTGDFPSNCEAIRNEAQIYSLLGNHPRIAKCLSMGLTDDHIDLQYYANGTLLDYIKKNGKNFPNAGQRRWQWGQQIIEAVILIHNFDIIHSDLALRQYLLDDQLDARLSDFGASAFPGHNALGFENASHCLPRDFDQPNTVESDLFALGSTLYELGTGMAPYYDLSDYEISDLYARKVFPDVSGISWGEIILQCWKTNFISAEHVLLSYNALFQIHSTTWN